MSYAFEITPEDVLEVLALHGAADSPDDDLVEDAYVAVIDLGDRITEAVLEYGDGNLRRVAALQEIEAILIEDGLLDDPPRVGLQA